MGSTQNVQLSDPVTLVLRQALGKLRVARVLSEQQATRLNSAR
jgi:hypothetical protein